jgi:hypothetical protein
VEGPTSGNVVEASHMFLAPPPSPNTRAVIETVGLREFSVDNTKDQPFSELGDFVNENSPDNCYGCLVHNYFSIICEVTATVTVRPDRTVFGCRDPLLNEPKIQVTAKHKKQLQVNPKNSSVSEQNELVNASQKPQQLLQNEEGETLTTSQKGQPQNQDKTLATSQKCQQLNQQLENSFR